jgi:thioredoxin reductase
MNFRVDVIIVGDSKAGHEILDKIASYKPAINIAFISKTFKSTTTHDYTNVKYFKDEVEYVSYRHRLFCCYMKNGDNIFSTHLVIASGLEYEPLTLNSELVPCVFSNADDIPKTAKDQPALVICNQDADAKLALEVSKKYKQVYLCTKGLTLTESTSKTTAAKLENTSNLVVLPNTAIKKVVSDKGVLQKVELDNYSEVSCSAIYTKTSAKPAIEFIPRKILVREGEYPVVNENCESTLVPGCFAAGNCLNKYTKAMQQKLVESILKDF